MPSAHLDAVLRHLRRLVHAEAAADLTDGELLTRFINRREETAFTLLLQRHGPMVLAVCRRVLQDRDATEDAFQATFVVLARRAGSVRRRASLASWLYGVALRVARRVRAQASARCHHERLAATMAKREPDNEPTWDELRQVLDEEIAALPEKYQAPLVLHYLEGKTQVETASALRCPRCTVRDRLEQGRKLLRERLVRRGVTLTGGTLAATLAQQAAPAAVPATITLAAVRAAMGGTLSASAAAIVQDVVCAMGASKLKALACVIVLLGIAAGGTISAAHRFLQEGPATEQQGAARSELPSVQPKMARRTDLYGDPLPPAAVARLGTVRYRGVPQNWMGAFDAENKTYVAESDDGVMLTEIQTGKILRRFPATRASAAAISPDGRTVAAASDVDDMVWVWDAATGRELCQLRGETGGSPQVLLFTPDGKRLVRNNRLWDLATGKEIWKRKGGEPSRVPFTPRLFFPDGSVLVGIDERAKDDGIVFVETASGRELRRLKGLSGQSARLNPTFSRDCKLLAAHGPGWVVQVWDLDAGKKLRDIPGLRSTSEGCALSPEGKILAWSREDKSLHLVDVQTGKEVRRVAKDLGTATRLRFLRDEKTLAFCLWHESTVRIWDLQRDCELYPLGGNRGHMAAVLYMPDGRTIVSASMDNTIRYWEVASSKELVRTDAHKGGVWGLAMTADGKALASASPNDLPIRIWSTATRKETGRLMPKEPVHSLTFSADGRHLLSGSGGGSGPFDSTYTLCLWDVAAGNEIRRWITHSEHCPIALSPNGRLVASQDAGSIVVWDVHTGRQVRQFPILNPLRHDLVSVHDLTFSPDGRTLVSAIRDAQGEKPQNAIQFWEVATAKERLPLKPIAPAWGKVLACSPDGQHVALGGEDRSVHILDTSTGEVVRQFKGHDQGITSVAFAPDGKSVATGSMDTTVLIWNLDDLPRPGINLQANLTSRELDILWDDLAGFDAVKAYRAIVALSAVPQTSAYLAQRLRPVTPADPIRLTSLITDLDNKNYARRDKAAADLAALGDLAEPALRKVMIAGPSLELQRRVETLLRKLDEPVASRAMMRSLRAIEVLERIGTPEAESVIRSLAAGLPEARVTRDVKATLERLAMRSAWRK